VPQREQHVALLLAKAAQDEYVLDRLLNDPDVPHEVYGFHAQQAAEKLLKAILSHAGIEYPRTHQLAELLDPPAQPEPPRKQIGFHVRERSATYRAAKRGVAK
jgi:hypothetical protein